jgi:cytochrome c oxidase subunit 2
VVTAGELYLPIGRKVNFTLRTADVLHSFWIPQMGGKRDVISNHVNYLWFTPDSTLSAAAWNGTCNEYCGASHGNMKFRVFTVPRADFARWAAHQARPAVYPDTGGARAGGDSGYAFPAAQMPDNAIPHTPLPPAETFATGLTGDPAAGLKTYSASACIGCHTIAGNPMSMGIIGPNLTHIASRRTIGAGLYPNDGLHLEYWIKNAHAMKPGVAMVVLGKGEIDPVTGKPAPTGTLTDQQIADIVAYLQQLQ